jgi:hypothetical protein
MHNRLDSRSSTAWITPSKILVSDDPMQQLEGHKENAIVADDILLASATDTSDKEPMVEHKSNNMIQVSVFHIFPTGLFCSRCDKPIGCGIESVRQHMRSSHPVLWDNIDNFSKFHATILSATNQLKALQLPMAL